MEHKIINIGDYLLIVDESEIKEGDWVTNKLHVWKVDSYYGFQPNTKKIISHLPLNNSPILEGVDLLPDLPSLEDEVEKLAYKYDPLFYADEFIRAGFKAGCIDGFKAGYNKAKEKYKYTEEDLRKVINKTIHACNKAQKESYGELVIDEDEIIQSLQQPKIPVGFRRKEGGFVISGGLRTGDESQPPGLQTHTHYETLTMDGKVLWVGDYVY